MSNYPAGVTDATIDALYEDAWQEERRQETYAWLTSNAAWWRSYVKADRRGRRANLIDVRDDEVGYDLPDMSRDELVDYAEDLRNAEIRWARAMAARHLRWQRNVDLIRAIAVDAMMMGGQR